MEGDSIAYSRRTGRCATYNSRELWVWSKDYSSIINYTDYADDVINCQWTPDGQHVAVALSDGYIILVDAETMEETAAFDTRTDRSHMAMAWTEHDVVATTFSNDTIMTLQLDKSGRLTPLVRTIAHAGASVLDIVQLSRGRSASCGTDGSVRVWSKKLSLKDIYEPPDGHVCCSVKSGRVSARDYIAAATTQGSIHVFDVGQKRHIATLSTGASYPESKLFAGFSSDCKRVAITFPGSKNILLWNVSHLVRPLDGMAMAPARRQDESTHYQNAKVVLVGDSGVGKSGLALRLAGQDFTPTESTHGRQVVTLFKRTIDLPDNRKEVREVLLWDLAGQPGYRLFHRLSLRDVSIGLILFDARDELDPLRGIDFWNRALEKSAMVRGELQRALVSSRVDRGTLALSNERIQNIIRTGGYHRYFETSAKTGDGVNDLREWIENEIVWSDVPVVVAPDEFGRAREFLVKVKGMPGSIIKTQGELLDEFAQESEQRIDPNIFGLCLQRLEKAGLVAQISVGDRWLLQPELLDSYVAWMAQAARREPDGLGSILESDASSGRYHRDNAFSFGDERLMLLIAVEEVLGQGLAVRVPTERGQMLVFPSELRTDLPDYPGGYDLELSFEFSGPVSAIYAAVAVRLVNSLTYGGKNELFKNAALFRPERAPDTVYGFAAQYISAESDAEGRIVVFFGGSVDLERKLGFLRYIDYQLQQAAVSGSIQRKRIYSCCGMQVPDQAVQARATRNETTVICAICGRHIPMDDLATETERLDRATIEADYVSIAEQRRQKRLTVLPARRQERDYDTFICYNSVDRPSVMALDRHLRNEGINAWLDVRVVQAGRQFAREIERIIDRVRSAIIVFGPNSFGSWQEQEYYALLEKAVSRAGRGLRLIPVLLPGGPREVELPPFARTYSVLDLRVSGVESFDTRKLVQAIVTANQPDGS